LGRAEARPYLYIAVVWGDFAGLGHSMLCP
jgi:hypothetical protein